MLAVLFALQACSQMGFFMYEPSGLTTINIIDQNGLSETYSNADRLKQYENVNFLSNQPYQKVMRVYGKDAQGNSRALITSYHPNGQIRQYLEVVNNRALGEYKEWYETGRKKLSAYIVGGVADINTAAEKTWLFEGTAKAWDENECLEAEIQYAKGLLQGESKYYHPSGKLWKRLFYRDNKLEGNYEILLENGEILQSTCYKEGQRHGPSKRYWTPEQLAADETYENDLLITAKYYNRCGEEIAAIEEGNGYRTIFNKDTIFEIQEYQNGVLEGEVSVFDEKENLMGIYHMQNQLKHGEEIEYFPPLYYNQSPQPMLSIQWYEGKIQGVCKTWYRNGKLESQREMSKNKKNGICLAYYNDGNLMLIEEYEMGKLFKGKYFKKGDKRPVSEVISGNGLVTMHDAEGNYLHKFSYAKGMPGK